MPFDLVVRYALCTAVSPVYSAWPLEHVRRRVPYLNAY